MERWNRMRSAAWWMCYTRSTSTPACTRAQRKHWRKWSWDGEAIVKYASRGMRLPMQMDSSPSCTGFPSVPWKTSSGTRRPLLHRLVTIVRSLRLLISVPQSAVCRAHFCFQTQLWEQKSRVPLPLRLLPLEKKKKKQDYSTEYWGVE